MEHLDKEHHQEACEYTIIGGSSSKLSRCPSSLMASPAPSPKHNGSSGALLQPAGRCPRCQLRKRGNLGSSSSADEAPGSRSSSSLENGGAVAKWDEEDIMAWLREIGMEMYEVGNKLYTLSHWLTGLHWAGLLA